MSKSLVLKSFTSNSNGKFHGHIKLVCVCSRKAQIFLKLVLRDLRKQRKGFGLFLLLKMLKTYNSQNALPLFLFKATPRPVLLDRHDQSFQTKPHQHHHLYCPSLHCQHCTFKGSCCNQIAKLLLRQTDFWV